LPYPLFGRASNLKLVIVAFTRLGNSSPFQLRKVEMKGQ